MKRTAFFASFLMAGTISWSQTKWNDTTELIPVEVRAVRASNSAPFTKTNLAKTSIEKQNLGKDLPFLLNQTPSTVVSSDAGNGIGYTGLRIRGTDLTRINVTLNGIPYNDPESQSVYFVDLPDFASSVSNLQIQRGVGTSSNGAGSFGATINLSTNEVNEKPYAELYNSVGSFRSHRHTIKLGTGLLSNHFTIDARLSKIESDGFIDRASSDLQSYYLSGAWMNKKSSIRLNLFSGREKTYQSWNGVPEFKLFYNEDSLISHYYNNLGSLYFTEADSINLFTADPRRYNVYLYDNQTDNYRQDHYQLFFNHAFQPNLNLSTALFLTHGEGFYEEYKYNQKYSSYGLPDYTLGGTMITRTDLVRQLWLKNNLYGINLSLEYKKQDFDLLFGGNINRFDGHHYGNITWAQQGIDKDYQWYRYPATKTDGNVFTKLGYKLTQHLYAMADLQYRQVNHNMAGTRKFPKLAIDQTYHFFNPKAGLTYQGHFFNAYVSYAVANKEPNRTDFETGSNPKPEHLQDFELGLEHIGTKGRYGITGYYMRYKDQLVLTGKLNDVGDAIRINVPKSYRLGLEAWGGLKVNNWLRIEGNITVSENKLRNYEDYVPKYDLDFSFTGYQTLQFKNAQISFSPWLTAFGGIGVQPTKNLELVLNSKAVSKQYLDNTQSEYKKINGYFLQDIQANYAINKKDKKIAELIFQVYNIWNKKYESNGYTYSYYYDTSLIKENFYYPMAGTNWALGLNIKL